MQCLWTVSEDPWPATADNPEERQRADQEEETVQTRPFPLSPWSLLLPSQDGVHVLPAVLLLRLAQLLLAEFPAVPGPAVPLQCCCLLSVLRPDKPGRRHINLRGLLGASRPAPASHCLTLNTKLVN